MPAVNELGRRLQLVHAAQWLSAAQGDPFARILLGYDEDPYPAYTELREHGGLVRSRDGVWVTAHHRAGAELLAHPALGARRADGRRSLEPVVPLEDTVLGAERAELDRLRAAAEALLARTRPLAEQACTRVLADLDAEPDLVTGVAERVPMEVLADLFELDGPDRARLAEGVRWAGLAQDGLLCPQALAHTRRMLTAVDDLRDLFDARDEGVLLALLGVRIATDLVANCLLALLSRPWQWSKLVADPGGAVRAVAETLRHDPPVQMQALVAHRDLTADGSPIPAGDRVVVLLGGANRDPEAFPGPADFDLDRPAVQGPVLLPGLAYEPAVPFGRTVAEAVVHALAGRFPRLVLAGPPLRRRRAPVTRGLLRLPVTTRAPARTA